MLTEGDGFDIDLKDFPSLPACAILGSDPDGTILRGMREGVNLPGEELPVIIVADTFNRVVFASQGYTIGIGDRLAGVISKIK